MEFTVYGNNTVSLICARSSTAYEDNKSADFEKSRRICNKKIPRSNNSSAIKREADFVIKRLQLASQPRGSFCS